MLKTGKGQLWLISLFIGLVSIAYYLTYYKHFMVDVDEGLLINGALRVLDGELPLKDFHQYMPGRYGILALWFLLVGKSIAAERFLFVLVHAAKNILMFHVARRIVPLPFSLLPVLLLTLLPGFWVKADINAVLLLNIFLLLKYLTPPHRKKHLVFLGLSVGFSALFREDMAGYSFLAVGIVLLVKGLLEKERFWSILRQGLLFSSMILAVIVPVILFYASQEGLSRFVQGIWETVRLGQVESSAFESPLAIPRRLSLIFPYLAILLFLVMIPVLISRLRRNIPAERTHNLDLLAVFVLAVLSFFHIWHWTHEFRIIQTGSLIHVLWALAIFLAFKAAWSWGRERRFLARLRAAAFGLGLVLALAVQVFLVVYSFTGHERDQYDAGGISLRAGVHREITGTDRAKIRPPVSQAIPYSRMLFYLNRFTSPEDVIHCFGESIFYFLSGRKNATEFDNGRIPSYFPEQRKVFLSQLWNRKPRVILIRKWEFEFWSHKMPEVFQALIRSYFLDREVYYYYVFSYVSDLDDAIRQGNLLFWNADVTGAAGQYWASLQRKRQHPELKKILSRFFFSPQLAERGLPVLEGFALKKEGDTWRLRWGSLSRRRFSGTVAFPGSGHLDQAIRRVSVFPEESGVVTMRRGPGPVLSFRSDVQGAAAGLDIVLAAPAGPEGLRFEFAVDGEEAAFVFLNECGLIPVAEIVRKAPRP